MFKITKKGIVNSVLIVGISTCAVIGGYEISSLSNENERLSNSVIEIQKEKENLDIHLKEEVGKNKEISSDNLNLGKTVKQQEEELRVRGSEIDRLEKENAQLKKKRADMLAAKERQATQVQVASSTNNSSNVSANYNSWTKMTVNASAYTSYENGDELSGRHWGNFTASGVEAYYGAIASSWDVIPQGTEVYIPMFNKVFIVEDTGNAIKGNKIDIYMNTLEECIQFGRQNIEIYVNY